MALAPRTSDFPPRDLALLCCLSNLSYISWRQSLPVHLIQGPGVVLLLSPWALPQLSPYKLSLLSRDQEVNRLSMKLPDEPTSLAQNCNLLSTWLQLPIAPTSLGPSNQSFTMVNGSSFTLLCLLTPPLYHTQRLFLHICSFLPSLCHFLSVSHSEVTLSLWLPGLSLRMVCI